MAGRLHRALTDAERMVVFRAQAREHFRRGRVEGGRGLPANDRARRDLCTLVAEARALVDEFFDVTAHHERPVARGLAMHMSAGLAAAEVQASDLLEHAAQPLLEKAVTRPGAPGTVPARYAWPFSIASLGRVLRYELVHWLTGWPGHTPTAEALAEDIARAFRESPAAPRFPKMPPSRRAAVARLLPVVAEALLETTVRRTDADHAAFAEDLVDRCARVFGYRRSLFAADAEAEKRAARKGVSTGAAL